MKVWTDDPRGFSGTTLPVDNQVQFGDANNPINKIYVTDVITTGSEEFTDLTVTNDLDVGNDVAVTGDVAAAGYDLADGSDKNYSLSVYAAGTAYSLTNTAAALNFGTTDPVLTIDKAGTYLLIARAVLDYAAATFAASRAVTLKLRRTNNTAADLTNGSVVVDTDIITTLSYTFGAFALPPVLYTTANLDDAITIFGDVAVVPTAGSLDAVAASIVAVRLY